MISIHRIIVKYGNDFVVAVFSFMECTINYYAAVNNNNVSLQSNSGDNDAVGNEPDASLCTSQIQSYFLGKVHTNGYGIV